MEWITEIKLEVRIKKILLLMIAASLGLFVFAHALAELSPEARRLFDLAKTAQVQAHQSNPNGNIDQAAWRTAADAAEAAVVAAPLEVAPLRLRAQVYTEIGFWIRAESGWRALQTVTQNQLTPEDRAGFGEVLYNLGYGTYQSGDLETALAHFREAAENTPDAARVEIWQGRILLERGDARGALPHWERAVMLEPNNVSSKYFLLVAQKSEQYGKRAVSAFTLGRLAFEAKNWNGALAQFRIAIVNAPAFVEAQQMMGRTALELNLSDEAVLAFENVSRLEGVNATNMFNLKLAREMQEFGAVAVRSFRTGYDLYVKGDRAGALAAFEAATTANPNYQKAWTWLGRSRFEAGEFGGAVEAYSMALKLDPNDKNSQYWLRLAKSKIG
jgi:tetratricopeptide (TPR) repeat protein